MKLHVHVRTCKTTCTMYMYMYVHVCHSNWSQLLTDKFNIKDLLNFSYNNLLYIDKGEGNQSVFRYAILPFDWNVKAQLSKDF